MSDDYEDDFDAYEDDFEVRGQLKPSSSPAQDRPVSLHCPRASPRRTQRCTSKDSDTAGTSSTRAGRLQASATASSEPQSAFVSALR